MYGCDACKFCINACHRLVAVLRTLSSSNRSMGSVTICCVCCCGCWLCCCGNDDKNCCCIALLSNVDCGCMGVCILIAGFIATFIFILLCGDIAGCTVGVCMLAPCRCLFFSFFQIPCALLYAS